MYDKLTILPSIIFISTLSGTTTSTNMKMELKIGIDIETLKFENEMKWNEEMKFEIGIDI